MDMEVNTNQLDAQLDATENGVASDVVPGATQTDLDSLQVPQVFKTPSPANPTSAFDSSRADATPTSVELPQKRAPPCSPPSNVPHNKRQSIDDKMQETQHPDDDDDDDDDDCVEIVEVAGDYICLCFVSYFNSFLIPSNIEYK